MNEDDEPIATSAEVDDASDNNELTDNNGAESEPSSAQIYAPDENEFGDEYSDDGEEESEEPASENYTDNFLKEEVTDDTNHNGYHDENTDELTEDNEGEEHEDGLYDDTREEEFGNGGDNILDEYRRDANGDDVGVNEVNNELRESADNNDVTSPENLEDMDQEGDYRDFEDEEENEAMRDHRARSNFIVRYKKSLEERAALQKKLNVMVKSLAEHFKQAKKLQNDDLRDKPASDSEERYNRYVREYKEMKQELDELLDKNRMQLLEMRNGLEIRQQSADMMRLQFLEHKLKTAQEKARYSRTGKPIPAKKVEELQKMEHDKYERVRNMRIQYFELRNTKQALDQSIKEKEEFSKGLHMIHYEQLKMENSSLSDKIEEKNESLQKAQLKSINAVHVWAHTREKLQYEQNQDAAMHARLGDLETEIEQYKKDLTAIKNEQDLLKHDTHEMRNQAPLVTNTQLLMDFELRKNELDSKQRKYKQLRETHKDLMRQITKYESMIYNMKAAMVSQSASGFRSRARMPSSSMRSNWVPNSSEGADRGKGGGETELDKFPDIRLKQSANNSQPPSARLNPPTINTHDTTTANNNNNTATTTATTLNV